MADFVPLGSALLGSTSKPCSASKLTEERGGSILKPLSKPVSQSPSGFEAGCGLLTQSRNLSQSPFSAGIPDFDESVLKARFGNWTRFGSWSQQQSTHWPLDKGNEVVLVLELYVFFHHEGDFKDGGIEERSCTNFLPLAGFEPTTFWSQVRHSTHWAIRLP